MSDPFRDGMEAAMLRSETLEEENELLREEIARIREQAAAIKEGAKEISPETHAIADQTLDVLDRLAAISRRPEHVRVALDAKVSGEMRPLDAATAAQSAPAEHGTIALPPPKPKPAPSPRIDTGGVAPGLVLVIVVLASLLSFLLGTVVSAVMH